MRHRIQLLRTLQSPADRIGRWLSTVSAEKIRGRRLSGMNRQVLCTGSVLYVIGFRSVHSDIQTLSGTRACTDPNGVVTARSHGG